MPTTPPERSRGGWRDVAPGRVRDGLTEAILLVLVLVAFTRVHAAVGTDVAVATDNAHALQSVERRLRLNIELALNRWLARHGALITPSVLVYRLYYAILLGVLLWVFFRHADIFRHVRRTFVAMSGLALLVYWAVPMAPPRLALGGIVDIVAEHDVLGSHGSHEAHNFSAMPSVHVGWSAWAAYAAWCALRKAYPRGALLAWAFPLVMIADVIATGNHYVLDVVGSGVLLVAAILVARGWDRLAEHWELSPPDVDREAGAGVQKGQVRHGAPPGT